MGMSQLILTVKKKKGNLADTAKSLFVERDWQINYDINENDFVWLFCLIGAVNYGKKGLFMTAVCLFISDSKKEHFLQSALIWIVRLKRASTSPACCRDREEANQPLWCKMWKVLNITSQASLKITFPLSPPPIHLTAPNTRELPAAAMLLDWIVFF